MRLSSWLCFASGALTVRISAKRKRIPIHRESLREEQQLQTPDEATAFSEASPEEPDRCQDYTQLNERTASALILAVDNIVQGQVPIAA